MSARTPQVGDIVRHIDEEGRFGFQYYGEGTVQSASGTHMSVYFPKRGANYTLRTDDPALQAREPEAAAPVAPPRPEAPKPVTGQAQAARKPGKATDKQVKYAMSLLRRDHEYLDEVLGAADDDLTRRNLERMTSAQISSLISDLRKKA